MATEAKTLCYVPAARKRRSGTITEQQYFSYLFQHLLMTGVEHPGDEEVHEGLHEIDPVAYEINCWVNRSLEPVDDILPFLAVFANRNEVDSLARALEELHEKRPNYTNNMRKTLALLLLRDRNAKVLKWLLSEGISCYESTFEDEAIRVKKDKDPETWKVLKESDYVPKLEWRKKGGPLKRSELLEKIVDFYG